MDNPADGAAGHALGGQGPPFGIGGQDIVQVPRFTGNEASHDELDHRSYIDPSQASF
jgi:hypothetical protein